MFKNEGAKKNRVGVDNIVSKPYVLKSSVFILTSFRISTGSFNICYSFFVTLFFVVYFMGKLESKFFGFQVFP